MSERICTDCNQSRAIAKGMCKKCYQAKYHKKYYEKNKQVVIRQSKAYSEVKLFGGNRGLAMSRDGNKCVRCGGTKGLCCHHKDRSGSTPKPNNSLNNLETLCRRCHAKEHAIDLAEANMKTSCKLGHRHVEHATYNGRQWVCRTCNNAAKDRCRGRKKKEESKASPPG